MKRIAVLALFGLILRPVAVTAQEAPAGFAATLPAETLVYLEVDDLGGTELRMKESALGRIWAEPEVQQFVKGLSQSIGAGIGAARGGFDPLAMFGLAMSDFEGIAVRQVGFAVVGMQFERPPFVDAVLSVEFRGGGEKAQKIILAAKQAIETFVGIPFTESDLNGRKIHTAAPMGIEFCFSAGQDRFLLTTGRARLEQCLAGPLPPSHSLVASPRYTKIVERMGARRRALFCYFDAAQAIPLAMKAVRDHGGAKQADEASGVMKTLGLDAMEAIAFADIPDGAEMRTELAVTLSGRRGLFALAPPAKVNHRFARYVPADTMLYGAARQDLDAILRSVLALVDAFEPGSSGEFDALLARYNAALGVDLRQDLLRSLGEDWAAYVDVPQQGGLIPDFAIFVSVKNREALERSLEALAKGIPAASALHGERAAAQAPKVLLRECQFRGQRIRFVELSGPRGEPIPVAPSWAFVDDAVVFALFPQTIKHALAEKPSLAASPRMRGPIARLPASTSSCSLYDTTLLFTWIYNTVVPLAQGAQGALNAQLARFGVTPGINLADLPPAEVIARHLQPTVTYTAAEEDCLRMGFLSPYGSTLLAVPVVVAGAAAFLVMRAVVAPEVHHVAVAPAPPPPAAAPDRERLGARIRELEQQIEDLHRRLAEIERR